MSDLSDKPSEWIGWKIIDSLAKIAIPLSVAFFGMMQSSTSLQNEIAKQEADRELKLTEIAWTSLMDNDSKKKHSALKLLGSLRPELALKFSSAVSQDMQQPPDVRREASQFTADMSASLLQDYKIDIYYLKNEYGSAQIANDVKTLIENRNLKNKVVIAPREENFFTSTGSPRGNEVRYEPGTENKPSQALAALINSSDISSSFQLRPVVTHTPNTLSVYIWKTMDGSLPSDDLPPTGVGE